jgi:putative polymerase
MSGLFVPACLVIAATLFNPVLAIINGHIASLSSSHIILAELMIVGAAHGWILLHVRTEMIRWYAVLGFLAGLALVRTAGLGDLDIKFLRDVLLIPTFILLGLTVRPTRALNRIVAALMFLVAAVMLFEAYALDSFSAVFQVKDFYISTRGVDPAEFTNPNSELYVSATRPTDRFIGFVDWHRLSSVFLEPVSLGNFCVIMTGFICARWRTLTIIQRVILVGGNCLLLVGSDGRLALISSVIVIAAALVAGKVPKRSAALYLPATLGLAVVLVSLLELSPGTDDFPGRIAYTVDLLSRFELFDWLGISNRLIAASADSGIAYLILTQSLFGLTGLWCSLVYLSDSTTTAQTRYLHGVCIYLALTMVVSYSFLTIKTAAVLWFIFGVLQNKESPAQPASRSPAAASALWLRRR